MPDPLRAFNESDGEGLGFQFSLAVLKLRCQRENSNLTFIEPHSIYGWLSLFIVDIQFGFPDIWRTAVALLLSPFCSAAIWNDQKGDRMLRRMVRVVLMYLSAIVPQSLALQRIPLRKNFRK